MDSDRPDLSQTPTRKIVRGDVNDVQPIGPVSGRITPAMLVFPEAPPPVWEKMRPSFEYHLMRYAQMDLFQAPLVHPQRIADIGCNYGHWVVDMARLFPAATIVGVDTVLVTATAGQELPNAHFIRSDVLGRLPFADASCDYTHLQFRATVIPIMRWMYVLNELFRITRPGGWIEIREMGLPRIGNQLMWIWIARLGREFGLELFPGKAVGKWLTQHGGVNCLVNELLLTRGNNLATSGRLMLRDGVAVAEIFREEILQHGITTPTQFDEEVQRLKYLLFHPNRVESLAVCIALCQRP